VVAGEPTEPIPMIEQLLPAVPVGNEFAAHADPRPPPPRTSSPRQADRSADASFVNKPGGRQRPPKDMSTARPPPAILQGVFGTSERWQQPSSPRSPSIHRSHAIAGHGAGRSSAWVNRDAPDKTRGIYEAAAQAIF